MIQGDASYYQVFNDISNLNDYTGIMTLVSVVLLNSAYTT